jgi:TetR/AcrR family transcriptional regulator, transcriptional repressor for nem operon
MADKGELTRDRILDAAETLIMSQGFAGTSIDEILKGAGLTKGAFFHHFKGKGDLARVLVERHAQRDLTMFQEFAAQADAASDDPLERTYVFLEAFERFASNLEQAAAGCMYATYTYESMQFEPAIRDFVADALRRWTSMYVRRFQEVLDRYQPALPVTARQLGEMIASIIEGGLVFQRAYGDMRVTARQSEQFRNYLELLFGGRKAAAGKKAPRQDAKRRSGTKAYA